jgi:hypothetical protein
MPSRLPATSRDICTRAATLAASPDRHLPADAEVLIALADGTLGLDSVDDYTLERLAQTFGIDEVADVVRAAPLPPVDPASAGIDAAEGAGARRSVLPFRRPGRIPGVAGRFWLAAAATVALAAAATTLTYRWRASSNVPAATQTVDRSAPPSPAPDSVAPPPQSREATPAARHAVLVLVRGDDPERVRQAEAALLRTAVERHGFEALAPAAVSTLRQERRVVDAAFRGDATALSAISREYGLGAVVVGDLTSDVVRSAQEYEGRAKLSLKLYRPAEEHVIVARDLLVGGRGARLAEAATEAEARVKAAQEALRQASAALRGWLADPPK